MTRILRPTILLCALALVLVAGSLGCRRPPGNSPGDQAGNKPREEKVFLSPVLVQKVERGDVLAMVATTGSILPVDSVSIRTEEAGELAFAKDWSEGDHVEEDELIARIESEALEREHEITEADVRIANETLEIGQKILEARVREYRTLQDLYSRGIAALKEVDAVKLEVDRSMNSQRQNEINLAKAESRLEEIEERLKDLEIHAPFDGLLVSRATLEGQGRFTRGFGSEAITDYDGRNVSAGQVLCGLVDISKVYMRCNVTSKDVGRVFNGQEAKVTVYARDDIERQGVVQTISNSVDPETRAFNVDILLQNEDGVLKPGMFGKSEIVTDRRRDAISVPKTVITRRNNQDVVFIVDQPADTDYHVAKMVQVELGLEGKDEIEVTYGLQSGDQIIMRGFEVLQDKTPINPIDIDEPIRQEEEVQITQETTEDGGVELSDEPSAEEDTAGSEETVSGGEV